MVDKASVVILVLLLAIASAPKFVKALAVVVAPVPPLAIAIVVPLHVPAVIVPTVAMSVPTNFEAVILPAKSPFIIEAVRFNFEYAIAAVLDTSALTISPSLIFAEVIDPSATPAAAVCAST